MTADSVASILARVAHSTYHQLQCILSACSWNHHLLITTTSAVTGKSALDISIGSQRMQNYTKHKGTSWNIM